MLPGEKKNFRLNIINAVFCNSGRLFAVVSEKQR